MTQSTHTPGIMAFTPALSSVLMFPLTMFTPACPKPSAKSVPSLMMVFSRIAVSAAASSWFELSAVWRQSATAWYAFVIVSLHVLGRTTISALSVLRRLCLCLLASSTSKTASAILMACRGSSRILFTFAIIRSIGFSTRLLASAEKATEARERTMHTKIVVKIPKTASCFTKGRMSKKKAMCILSNCSCVIKRGLIRNLSAGLRSEGHLTV
mmetsp:Transcript_12504/g.31540  ORF Transcript_12504/g.31540 Transcript_12504/m.31540 type:complete len:212 (+) Transcript_12504:75-710(+)